MRTRALLLLLGVLLILPGLARAGEVVKVDADNRPYMYLADGQAKGIYPTLISEIYRRVGVPVSIQAVPWDSAIAAIDAGQAAVGGMYKTDERLQKYDFTDAIFTETLTFFVRSGETFAYTGVASLVGKTIGVFNDWSYGDEFGAARKEGKLTVEAAKSDAQNFEKLLDHRLDVVIAIKESGEAFNAGRQGKDQIVALGTPLYATPAFIAFNKSAARGELIASINRAIAAMKADGAYARIVGTINE